MPTVRPQRNEPNTKQNIKHMIPTHMIYYMSYDQARQQPQRKMWGSEAAFPEPERASATQRASGDVSGSSPVEA